MFLKDSCRQCGLKYHQRNICSAKNAECNKCRQIGHFARTCPMTNGSNRMRRTFDPELKKQRDRRRMTEFLTKKDAMNLPFHGLDRTEMTEMTFNSSLRRVRRRTTTGMATLRRERDALKLEVQNKEKTMGRVQEENRQLRLEIQNFKKEVLERVKEENQQLRLENKSVAQDLVDTKYKLHTVSRDYQQDKQRIRDLQKQNEQLKTVTSEKEELRQTVESLEVRLCRSEYNLRKAESDKLALQKQLCKVERDSAKLVQKVASLEESLVKNENQMKEKTDFILKLQKEIEIDDRSRKNLQNHCVNRENKLAVIRRETENQSTVSGDQGRSTCGKCGSRDRVHPRNRCPANGYLCGVCDRRGHFPVFCKIEKKLF